MLGSDERQKGGQDLLQLLHIQVSPFHSSLVDAMGCAAQQVWLWVKQSEERRDFTEHEGCNLIADFSSLYHINFALSVVRFRFLDPIKGFFWPTLLE